MKKRILVVDDEPDIVAVMKYTLEKNGFEVITAYNGEEGLLKAKENIPDLIVLDVIMPKMSGDLAGVQLHKNPRTSNIPIIFLTNVPMDFLVSPGTNDSESIRSNEYGDIFLPKLSREEVFLAAVNQCIQRGGNSA